jgi:hypothetical protein
MLKSATSTSRCSEKTRGPPRSPRASVPRRAIMLSAVTPPLASSPLPPPIAGSKISAEGDD